MRRVYRPQAQIAWLSGSPDGAWLAAVEAICSDRVAVAGDLLVFSSNDGTHRKIDCEGVDVTFTAWQGPTSLLFSGYRSSSSAIGLWSLGAAKAEIIWSDAERSVVGKPYGALAPGSSLGECAFLREGYLSPPEVVLLRGGQVQVVHRLGEDKTALAVARSGAAEAQTWTAPDGLQVDGWLLRPNGAGPHPLVTIVHGGPILLHKPAYLGNNALRRALLQAGCALFLPNPRGSSARGQAYARGVFGDMGGADSHDILSGIDRLVTAGIADPNRLGVMGLSYGGYMTAWLITQDPRFVAAVAQSPVTHWASQHFTCSVPWFCARFLDDRPDNPAGKYFTRSPVFHAAKARTPTLVLCGEVDRITPPSQALELYRALRLAGVESVLATYPGEGHWARSYPAAIDWAARTYLWLTQRLKA